MEKYIERIALKKEIKKKVRGKGFQGVKKKEEN